MGQKNPNPNDESDEILPALDHRGLTGHGKKRLDESELVTPYLVQTLQDADPTILRAICQVADAAASARYAPIQNQLAKDESASREIQQEYWNQLDDVKGLSLLCTELLRDQRDGVPTEEDPRLGF